MEAGISHGVEMGLTLAVRAGVERVPRSSFRVGAEYIAVPHSALS